MLDVDATGIRTGQIADELFVRRRVLEGVLRRDVEKALGLRFEIGLGDLSGVLLSLPGIDDLPVHQPGLAEALESGSAMPLRMESRIPEIETRWRVS